jgi:Raf kinase inhibitor-like YbhB/YbcL family protein
MRMKKFIWQSIGLIVLTIFLAMGSQPAMAGEFTLTSTQIQAGGEMPMEQVFDSFGCTGKNISPELHWSGIPEGAKSLALTVYDPDAPTGSGWWHWLIFNIDPQTKGLPANAGNVKAHLAPAGSVQSRTDFGGTGYGGPCPPPGDKPHRYIFTLFALDVAKLDLDENTPAAMVGFNLNQHAIGNAQMTALFGRKK